MTAFWLLGCLATTACGGAQTGPAAGAQLGPEVGTVQQFLPLESGTVLAYETLDEQTGETGLVVQRVHRPRPELVELDDGGTVQRLEIGPQGVSHSTGGHLLRAPVARGATFRGRFGTVTITRTDVAVEVPAGSFQGCIETVEEDTGKTKRATTTFCPDVGMASLQVEGSVRGDLARIVFKLRSHGPAVDIAEVPPPDDDGDLP